jgi:hypothetical protein
MRGLNGVLASSARRGHHWQDEGIGMLDDWVLKVRWEPYQRCHLLLVSGARETIVGHGLG